MSARKLDAEKVIAAVAPFMEQKGLRLIGSPSIAAAQPLVAEICGLEILFCPKGGRLSKTPPPCLMDIRIAGGKKVFSVWFHPVEIVRFERGPWVHELLSWLDMEVRQ